MLYMRITQRLDLFKTALCVTQIITHILKLSHARMFPARKLSQFVMISLCATETEKLNMFESANDSKERR